MSKYITNPDKGYVTTPVGSLMYVNIAGQGKANFNKNGFDYVATVELSGKEAKAFQEEVDAFIEENKPKKLKLRKDHNPYHTHKTNDKIEKGCIRFNFKTQTSFESGDTKVVNVRNGKNEIVHLTEGTKIGNGSQGRISGNLSIGSSNNDWWVTFWLNGVQLKTFVEYEENSGFDEMEGAEDITFEGAAEKPEKKKDKKKKKGKK